MSNLSLFDLSGKKALVTGGAKGIGRACAVALATAGADVAIAGRNEKDGARTVATLRRMGRDAVFITCDVSQPSQIEFLTSEVVERFGRLDIAVNNAGIYCEGDDESQTAEDWNRVIGVNLTGTWMCACAEMRQMVKQDPVEGKIINIASIAASRACSNGSYDASKAATVQLTKTLAARWGRYNINVNCISPSYGIAGVGRSRSLQERQSIRDFTPLGHVQRLEDLYGPVLFLASRASDFVTGLDLIVDGGHTLGAWMQPLQRSAPPRIDPAAEVVALKTELVDRGVAHDENGIIAGPTDVS